MTRPPLDSITRDKPLSDSSAETISGSEAFIVGLRLVFWLHPSAKAFRLMG